MRTMVFLGALLLAVSASAQSFKMHDGRDPMVHDRYPEVTVFDTGFVCTLWSGECVYAVSLAENTAVLEAQGEGGEKPPEPQHRLYRRSAREFEWEIVLVERPPGNVFSYPVYSKGLTFHYQGELTDQDVADGCRRPDSVVGSYAVYRSSGRNVANYPGGFQVRYETGKAFHVYRPRIFTAKGDWFWGELYMDSLEVTVTVPEVILRDPTNYPIIIDPTYGYSGTPASNQGCGQYEVYISYSEPGTTAEEGAIDSGYIYANWDGSMAIGVYNYNATYTSCTFTSMESDSIGIHGPPPGLGWQPLPWLSGDTLADATRYSIAGQFNTATTVTIGYDDGGGGANWGMYESAVGSWGFPANTSGFTQTNRDYGYYILYTATTGGPAATGAQVIIVQ